MLMLLREGKERVEVECSMTEQGNISSTAYRSSRKSQSHSNEMIILNDHVRQEIQARQAVRDERVSTK